jgi:hypothetical protein
MLLPASFFGEDRGSMKVGDLVTRAYKWPSLVSGIIVSESQECVDVEEDPTGLWSYDQISFEVLWSDGSLTSEMHEELLVFEETVNEDR